MSSFTELTRRVPVLLLLIALAGLLAATAQMMLKERTVTPMVSPLEYLIDPAHDLTLDDVIADNVHWRTSDGVPNFGFRDEAFWFKTTLHHDGSDSVDRLLELSYPILDHVHLFVIREGQVVQREAVGDDLPFEQRPIRHRNFVFPLILRPGDTTLIMRIATEGVVQAPLTLWKPLDFIEFYETQSIIDGAYFGVMIIMVFYNLILYLGIRERPYIYYVGHVGTATLFLATMHGLAYMHVWPEAVWWQSRSVPVLVSLSVVFIVQFVTSFLKIHSSSPIGRLFQVVLVAALVSTGLSFVLNYPVALRIAGFLSVTSLALSLVVSITGWLRGNRSARFLVLAWTAFVFGSIALALNKFGVLPRTPFTESGMLFGSMLDVVLLSIAMADRVRQERLLREEAQHRAIKAEMKARERLEDAVAQRTEQLEEALEQLKRANQRLELLSNLDGLTEAHNRRHFDTYLRAECMQAAVDGASISVALIDADHFKRINDTYGHMCGDDCLKQMARAIEESVETDRHLLARFGGEEFALVLPEMTLERAAALADKVRRRIEDLDIRQGDQQVPLSVSIGVACNQGHSCDPADLLDRADQALYEAKHQGRNRVITAS